MANKTHKWGVLVCLSIFESLMKLYQSTILLPTSEVCRFLTICKRCTHNNLEKYVGLFVLYICHVMLELRPISLHTKRRHACLGAFSLLLCCFCYCCCGVQSYGRLLNDLPTICRLKASVDRSLEQTTTVCETSVWHSNPFPIVAAHLLLSFFVSSSSSSSSSCVFVGY